VIFSTVLSDTRNGNIALKFADNPNLVNVAVSRAKDKFIIVTDSELFFKK
jgi:superfamily I DNA and/or RNA helicase